MSKGLIKALFVGDVFYLLSCLVHGNPTTPALHNLHTLISSTDQIQNEPSPLVVSQIERGPHDLRYNLTQANMRLASLGTVTEDGQAMAANPNIREVPMSAGDANFADAGALQRNDFRDPSKSAFVIKFVTSHTKAIARLRTLYGTSYLRSGDIIGTTPGTTKSVSGNAFLMAISARYEETEGHHYQAIADDSISLRIADCCSRLGTPYSYWAAQTDRIVVLGDLRDLIRENQKNSMVINAVRTALIYSPIDTSIELPISTELRRKIDLHTTGFAALGPDSSSMLPSAEFSTLPPGLRIGGRQAIDPNLDDATQAYTIQTLTQMLSLERLSPADRLSETDRLTQTDEDNPAQSEVALIGPFYRDMVRRDALTQARRAVLICATGVILARNANGQLPATSPDTLADPFSGGLLNYTPNADGSFIIYSTGDQTEYAPTGSPTDRFYNAFYREGRA